MGMSSQLLSNLPALIANLPAIMETVQIVFYIFLILTFGSLVLKGYRGFLPWWQSLLIRLGTGSLSLIGGISIGNYITFFNSLELQLLQLHIIMGGFIAASILLISFYFLTSGTSKAEEITAEIEYLKKKLETLKTRKETPEKIRTLKIIGAVLFLAFITFSFLTFKGFPTANTVFYNITGISEEEMNELSKAMSSEECAKAINFISAHSATLQNYTTLFDDPDIKTMIEEESGRKVIQMFLVTHEDGEIVIAVTDTGNCIATKKRFCICP